MDLLLNGKLFYLHLSPVLNFNWYTWKSTKVFCTLGCGCGAFDSNFLCAACDRHWEEHQTFFETASERTQNGLPVGESCFMIVANVHF